MGDSTHTLTASSINNTPATATVTVPASVQREQGISIDDEVEVTVEGLDGIFNSVSFIGNQVAGDRITIPAELVRRAGIERGDEYEFAFEKVVEDGLFEEDYAIADESVEDGDEEEEGLGRLFSSDDVSEADESGESEEEEESPSLGELFG